MSLITSEELSDVKALEKFFSNYSIIGDHVAEEDLLWQFLELGMGFKQWDVHSCIVWIGAMEIIIKTTSCVVK